jgi:hypothetical protein
MNGQYVHMVKSISLGQTVTKCGLSIHGITVDQGDYFGHTECGRCFSVKAPKSVSKKCQGCGTSIGQSKNDKCRDCREFDAM